MLPQSDMRAREEMGLGESREQAVQAELTHVLESPAFRTSKRCREFLEYIVAHTLSGPGGALKERSIGVELFRLAPDFDPGQHTIVRVTANELRKKLAQHYLADNGSLHPVRIHLPPGSYRAEFRWETPAAEPAAAELIGEPLAEPAAAPPLLPPPPVSARPNWLTRPMIACAVALLAIAGAFAWWRFAAVKPIAVDAKSGGAFPVAPIGSEDLRIVVGSTNSYMDRSGRKWGPDRFFSGGSALFRPSAKIARTLDPDMYRRLRQGEFQYDIPLQPGAYELHLHFAETGLADFISAESSGEGQRLFRVAANGRPILDFFDVVADAAGANTSDERVFRDISPSADGFLHLSFSSTRGAAMLSGIEVLPVRPGKVRPIRIRAGWTASWQDSNGQQWLADSYFLGGNALLRKTNPAQESNSAPSEMALYASERWGNFSYAVPAAVGRYQVTLKFCEGHYGLHNTGVGGLGSRVFDVYCNGVALLRNFDIVKEAGGEGRPLDRAFPGIRPNAQGKIVLSFVPIKGMACVNAIEVVEDSK